MPELSNIATKLGLSEDADEATILAKLDEQPVAPEGKVLLDQAQVEKLLADSAQGAAAAETLRVQTFETAFTTALDAGKTTPAQKDTFRALYDANAESTIKLLDELPKVVNMTPSGSGGAPGDTPEARALAADFQDPGSLEGYSIDEAGLQLHAAALRIEAERKVPYEQALLLAEAEVA